MRSSANSDYTCVGAVSSVSAVFTPIPLSQYLWLIELNVIMMYRRITRWQSQTQQYDNRDDRNFHGCEP